MELLDKCKNYYWKHFNFERLNNLIRGVLGAGINLLAKWQKFYFPPQYIRHWKTDMLLGWYEKESTALFKGIIKPGMTVIDIGAHIGYYTRLYSKLVGPTGKVLAFEADPGNYGFLKKNIEQFKNVKIFQVALTDHIGPIDFYESQEKTGCHSTVLGAAPLQTKIIVLGSDLDSILHQEEVAKVDVIKMDIEGGEPKAVRGMTQLLINNPKIILITELSFSRLNAGGVTPFAYLKQLEVFGFKFCLIELEKLVPFGLTPETVEGLFKESDFINVYCSKN